MEVKIKKLREWAIMPTKATDGSAAYDLYAPFSKEIRPGRQVIDLFIAIELPKGYEAKIEPRSGYSSKGFAGSEYYDKEPTQRFDCDVLTGKIDSDYRGSVGVIVNNRHMQRDIDSHVYPEPFYIKRGQRIAQMTIYKVEDTELVEVAELSETDRGEGGFGSSGN